MRQSERRLDSRPPIGLSFKMLRAMRRLALILFFLALCLLASARESGLAQFGQGDGFHCVIAIPTGEGDEEAAALYSSGKAFFERLALEGSPLPARFTLALMPNERFQLPSSLKLDFPEEANGILSILERIGGDAVIILYPQKNEGDEAQISCGAAGETAPVELLSALVEGLEEEGVAWRLEESRLDLYRIGWLSASPLLEACLKADVPAISISASSAAFPALAKAASFLCANEGEASFSRQSYAVLNLPRFLQGAAQKLIPPLFGDERRAAKGVPLLHLAGGRLLVLSEPLMVFAVILLLSFLLFCLCALFLLNPQTRKRRARELLPSIPLAALLAAFNFFALSLASRLAFALVAARFGKTEAWILLPRAALLTKLSFALFLSSIAFTLKSLFKAGRDPVSLAQAAAIASFANIFIFSALEFSIAPYFIICFFFVFASSRAKTLILQAALAALAALVFWRLYAQILMGNAAAIAALYEGGVGWNLLLAFFALPFQLMAASLAESAKPRFKARMPLAPLAPLALFAACALSLIFIPAWSQDKPLEVLITQSVTNEGLSVSIDGPAIIKGLKVKGAPTSSLSRTSLHPEDFVAVDFTSRGFLDRKVYELSIAPRVSAERIDVAISSTSGIAVNASPFPFRLEEGGRRALFSFSGNTDAPMVLSFITGTAGSLYAEISCWSADNPFGLYIDDKSVKASCLLFIKKEIELVGGEER